MKLAERIFKRTDYYITSPYGSRISPITGKQTFHYGCDYGTNLKKYPQYALEDGYIYEVGKSSGYGNYIYVKYPKLDYMTFHAHLDSVCVKNGDSVNNNTIIGYTGTTGQSTGIHLHLGVKENGNWKDPETYDYKEGDIPQMKYNIGDKVIINGDLYASSYADLPSGKVTNKETIITRISEKAPHPYNTTDDLGWMNESDIKLVNVDYEKLYNEEVEKNKILEEKLNAIVKIANE